MARKAMDRTETPIFSTHHSLTFGTSQKIAAVMARKATLPPTISGIDKSTGFSRPRSSLSKAKSPREIGELRSSIFILLATAKITRIQLTRKLVNMNHLRGRIYKTLKTAIKMMIFKAKRLVNSVVQTENGMSNAFRTIVSLTYNVRNGKPTIKHTVSIQTMSFLTVIVLERVVNNGLTLSCNSNSAQTIPIVDYSV